MISTDDIVKRVRILINEAEEEKSISLLTEDARSFDKSIRALIPQAVSIVQGNKKPGKRVNVRSVVPSSAVIVDNGDGSGYIALPGDFVSLLILCISGWERPCSLLFPASSQQAAWQRNSAAVSGQQESIRGAWSSAAMRKRRTTSLPAATQASTPSSGAQTLRI